jgi:hypothetical protein
MVKKRREQYVNDPTLGKDIDIAEIASPRHELSVKILSLKTPIVEL